MAKDNKPGSSFPLKLTQQQRESLLHCTRLKRSIKQKIEQAGEGTQTVLVTRKELDDLNDEIGQAALYAPNPDKKRLIAVLRKVSGLFEAAGGQGIGGRDTGDSPPPGPELGPALPVQDHAARHQAGDLAADSGAGLLARRVPRVHPSGLRLVELPPTPVRDRGRALRPTRTRRHGPRAGDGGRDQGGAERACCRSRTKKPGGFTNTTSATAGDTRFCSRATRRSKKARSTRCASKARGPAHLKIAAGRGATPTTSLHWPTPSTSSTMNCWSGGGRSIPRRSMRRRRRRR